ncbi:MAG: flagellar biosynthesis protein FliQ [Clostridiales bacterium]|nr:flagellar biosynthesis protein FliQ [Clostridiales bacterium]
MTDGMAMELARQALVTAVLVAAPVLGLGLLVSLLVSLFQATTQINEQTLTFIPKILAMLAGLLLFGPWMLRMLVDFTQRVWSYFPGGGG